MGETKTKAEILAEKMMSGDSSKIEDTSVSTNGRKKAARDWIQHFISVTKFIKELATKPESMAELEELLVASWEEKSAERDNDFATLIAGL